MVPELEDPLGLFLRERFAANYPKIARDFLKARLGFTTTAPLTESVVEAARRKRSG